MTKSELLKKYNEPRFTAAIERFSALYPDRRDARLFSAPGRTEVGGNHTDHNHGRVLAAAVDLDALAVAAPRTDDEIHLYSEGFGPITASCAPSDPDPALFGTPQSLLTGTANALRRRGFKVGGFDAYVESRVLPGSGLSSSAAFEVLAAEIENALYADSAASAVTMAQCAQEAENVYFGKPCGLMDQTACAVGGFVAIDFEDPEKPIVRPVHFDFAHSGYALVLTDTHASHADLTGHYASIPAEMKAAAQFFGREVLRGLTMDEVMTALPALRKAVGDRASIRAMHFISEDIRARLEAEALEKGDISAFLQLVRESGDSSWELLQNVIPEGLADQSLGLALAVSKAVLAGEGACRVHGGGFAGTIQAFVPLDRCEAYIKRLDSVFGTGSAKRVGIRQEGAIELL